MGHLLLTATTALLIPGPDACQESAGRLSPPFHRTVWFIALCIAAAASLAWLLHKTRLRLRHEAVPGERTRIAREFHDTIAQGLTGLTLHVEAALNHLHDPNRASEYLQTARKLARNTLTEARRALCDLRPEPLELMTDQLSVHGAVVVRGEPRRLADTRMENHLLRIAQEAVTNALRHARAEHIEIQLGFESARIRLSIRDDGQGSGSFSLEQLEASGQGVRGMRERAEQIGAGFEVRRNGTRGLEIAVEVRA